MSAARSVRFPLAVAALALSATLAACSGSSGTAPTTVAPAATTPGATTAPGAATTAPGSPTTTKAGAPAPTPAPPKPDVPDGTGAINALSGYTCKATGSKWSLNGTLTNPDAAKAQKFSVTATVVAKVGNAVVSRKTETYTLKPKEAKKVEMKDFADAPAEPNTCTVRVVTNPA